MNCCFIPPDTQFLHNTLSNLTVENTKELDLLNTIKTTDLVPHVQCVLEAPGSIFGWMVYAMQCSARSRYTLW